MKNVFFLICFAPFSALFAQKKNLNFSIPYTWPLISSKKISNDGRYVCYTIGSDRGAIGQEIVDSIMCLQAVDSSWKVEIPISGQDFSFTEDSRNLLFKKGLDSLGIFNLPGRKLWFIDKVSSFSVSGQDQGQWLVYKLNDTTNALVLRNLQTEEERRFIKTKDYTFNGNGDILLVQDLGDDAIKSSIVVSLFSASTGSTRRIGQGYVPTNVVFGDKGRKLAFLAIEGDHTKALRYYKVGMDSAVILVDSSTPGMEDMDLTSERILFDSKAEQIFLSIGSKTKPLVTNRTSEPGAQVRIWNYQDQSLRNPQRNGIFLAVVRVDKNAKVLRLQDDEDNLISGEPSEYISRDGNYVLFASNIIGAVNEYKWLESARPDIYLVSTRNGTRRILAKRLIGNCAGFSPSGKFVMWFDQTKKNWFDYDVELGTARNITKEVHESLCREGDSPVPPPSVGLAAWIEDDSSVLIYGNFDIWQVDLYGKKDPINITGGYGRRNNTELRIINFEKKHRWSIPVVRSEDSLLLSAFNTTTKCNGFFRLCPGRHEHRLQQLMMSPDVYYFESYAPPQSGAEYLMYPIKAKCASMYLLSRMNSKQYPNLVITSDFMKFEPVTKLAPERDYNWYTSELVHWLLPDGKSAEGILYKPESFSPRKKYPLIICYYERCSRALNVFIHPKLSNGAINIPWFVSNGYLVFLPDIHFKTGYPGESAYNCIVSGARSLSRFRWVDTAHIGLQGHSFGGWETYYLISRTSLFAAAAGCSGVSELISNYGRLLGPRSGGHSYFEAGQGRIGVPLWQKPELYISNSPIFKADKITTPLLIMHNQGDNIVPFEQGAELYTGMCRLGKRVWMLSYEGESHTIVDKRNAVDFSIRLGQFFDHFLKNMAEPRWMTSVGSGKVADVEYSLGLDDASVKQKPTVNR